ncbi:MAG TPA: acetyl-CoA carboxylase biotin carboxyl carrier protein [Terriglobales bacterium]|nr:acetyl-CoA carboxylase biotin carboxyl carrier protein [Terriglobales bacterium]
MPNQRPTSMDFDAIRKLIDTLIEKQIDEFELEEEGRRIRIKRGGPPPAAGIHLVAGAVPAVAPLAPPPAAPNAAPEEEAGLVTVTSPIVGTYYESPSPGAPEFIRSGDSVEVGQVLCIIEAMKLMNEIEAEVNGVLVRKLVTNGQPVEFGQALLLIRPRP